MKLSAKSITRSLTKIAPLALLLVAPLAFSADKGDPAFAKWWQKFQMAVMRHDIRAIDKGVEFPLDWQVSSEVRAARSESDFAANFGLFFTPEVTKNVLAGKPEKLANGNYVVNWKSNGKDYSLIIRFYNGVYAMESLIEGHP